MPCYAGIPPPKKEAVESIHQTVNMMDKNAKANFDQAFDIWKRTWSPKDNARSHKYVSYFILSSNQPWKSPFWRILYPGSGIMLFVSDTCLVSSITHRNCPEFDALLQLDPKYTPFTVYQLTKPGSLMACQVCISQVPG